MTESLLPVSKVLELTGHSRSGLYGAIRAGEYPAPVKRGRRSFWVKSELVKAIEAEKSKLPRMVGGSQRKVARSAA